MRVKIDMQADAAKVTFSDRPAAGGRSREVASGLVVDFDEEGRAVAMEIIGLRSRMAAPTIVEVEMAGAGELLAGDDPLVRGLRDAGALDRGPHAASA
jgi:uncharacterized protein YuzE